MRIGGGKAKGSAFERWTARQLSLWLSQGTRDDLLWRSAMSGGRAKLAGGKRPAQAGDLSAVDSLAMAFIGSFCIECKSRRNLSIDGFLLNGKGPLHGFWAKVFAEALRHGKYPMLICRRPHHKEYVLLTQAGADLLKLGPALALGGEFTLIYRFADLLEVPPFLRI